jgi:hypothetical protein
MKQATAIRACKARAPSAPPVPPLTPPSPPHGKLAYTIADLKKMGLGCKAYIYTQIGAGRLRATKRGRYTIVLAPDLDAWVASLPAIKPRGATSWKARCALSAAPRARGQFNGA